MSEAYLCFQGKAEKPLIYPIQFAPESMQISTEGRKKRGKRDFQERKGKPSGKTKETESYEGVNLHLHLLLDRSIEEKKSVQTDVEGLMEALKKCTEETHVTFCWNKMEFAGELSQLSAEYQMFDSEGSPVRAEVDFTICARDMCRLQEILEEDMKEMFK